MKGIVFTEFLELVEEQFGIETVDKIVSESNLETGGVYTAVGTYSHKEMFSMVAKLSEIKGIAVPDLLEFYGKYFFGVLAKSYPQFLREKGLFSFLETIDNYIHPEVLKLYPDAELPSFSTVRDGDKSLLLTYKSSRKMAHFAMGLILGASEHFETKIDIQKLTENQDGEVVEIKIDILE
jgi:hypothetical protein